MCGGVDERGGRERESERRANKNRLCSKTFGIDMNAERKKIWKNMIN